MRHTEERMNSSFTKYLLDLAEEGWPYYQPLLHHFRGPSPGAIHCHPWDFTIHVLKGGYIERVYHIEPDGSWWSELITRETDSVFTIKATHIHEIVKLIGVPYINEHGERQVDYNCFTIAKPGLGNRDWRHWRFDENGIFYRVWNEPDFKPYSPLSATS